MCVAVCVCVCSDVCVQQGKYIRLLPGPPRRGSIPAGCTVRRGLRRPCLSPALNFSRGNTASRGPPRVLRPPPPPPSLIPASARRRSPPVTSPHLHLGARRAVMHGPSPLINNSCCLLLAEVEIQASGPEHMMKTAAAAAADGSAPSPGGSKSN